MYLNELIIENKELDKMVVTTKQGKQATVEIIGATHSAVVVVDGVRHVVAFVRDSKKIVIKNDMILHDSDLAAVRQELKKFIKKQDDDKKKRRK
jgi:hypothetical protein